jgi:hypothetical protein
VIPRFLTLHLRPRVILSKLGDSWVEIGSLVLPLFLGAYINCIAPLIILDDVPRVAAGMC